MKILVMGLIITVLVCLLGCGDSQPRVNDNAIPRTAIFVVAASDTSATAKSQADYFCDGSDDQVEIQKAIEALPPGGGKVFLLEGKYNFSHFVSGESCIELSSNVWLQGSGMGNTRLLMGAGVKKNAIGAVEKSGVTISDLEIDGNKVNNEEIGPGSDSVQNGVYFRSTSNSTIERVYSHDNIFHGIFIVGSFVTGGSNNNRILDNRLARNRYRGIHSHTNCNYNLYENNYLFENGDGGEEITLGGLFVVYNGCSYNIVRGNTVMNDHKYGIHLEGGDNVCEGNVVVGNIVDCTEYSEVYGIYLYDTENLLNTTITNNIIKASRHGIVTEKFILKECDIEGNTIYAGVKGIFIQNAGEDLRICDNDIHASNQEALWLEGVTRSTISGNFMEAHSTWSGLRMVDCRDNIIQANNFYNVKHAIEEISGNSGNIIRDNRADSVSASPAFKLEEDDLERADNNITEGALPQESE